MGEKSSYKGYLPSLSFSDVSPDSLGIRTRSSTLDFMNSSDSFSGIVLSFSFSIMRETSGSSIGKMGGKVRLMIDGILRGLVKTGRVRLKIVSIHRLTLKTFMRSPKVLTTKKTLLLLGKNDSAAEELKKLLQVVNAVRVIVNVAWHVHVDREELSLVKWSHNPDDECKVVEALQVNYPLIDWEIHSEGSRSYWKIIRVGGITKAYQSFEDMLKSFDREDLDALWRLVKEKFSTAVPTIDKEKALWVELKRLFEPDTEDV
nr:leucine-rich repeat protein [Tanacetum cinerariifolium]